VSTPPLRIAHVVNEPFNPDSASGVQQVICCLAQSQADMGQSVAVFSRDDRAMYEVGTASASTPPDPQVVKARSKSSLRERLLARHFEPALAADVLAWQPQIVHFHSVHIPQNVALAAHLRSVGTPYCVTVHGGLFRAAMRRRLVKKTIFNLMFERRYLNEAVFIQAVSPHEVDSIRRYGVNTRVVVIPNGLPPKSDVPPSRPAALFEAHPSLEGRRIFMFVGRLDPWQKGLDLLIQAFARAGLREAALVLVGPDWFGSQEVLSSLAARLGISSQLIFTGQAFGADRANLFAAADVFVHPSRWEGLSLSVLAAAAAGKPCLITRDADPFGELERAQAALLVDANVAGIADGLRRAAALSLPELLAMGTRARTTATAKFDWPTIASRLAETYRSVLEKTAESTQTTRRRDGSHTDGLDA
jgi:glycosyltransferase involved in cell wall biosynthesis